MSSYRLQRETPASVRPIIVNCCNFSAPESQGTPALLTLGEVRTLFHELGHALHGLLSRTRYVKLAGTQVLRDFVEFPSQVLEHWALTPELLRKHARHHATDEPIPEALIEKIHAAARFNQGFETVEYIASALADLDLHELTDLDSFDPDRFEAEFLVRESMPPAIHLRHRLPHFQHVFSSPGYASKYYVYLWAGVLDADGFGAFAEAGDPFAPGPASRLKECIYSRGNSVAPMEAYIAFRGRAPTVEPLLRKKGLLQESLRD
jgi:peptidyl-dipeptidase Dcp